MLLENQLVVVGLYAKGVEFAQKIKADDVAGRKARHKFIADNEDIFQRLSQETRDEMAKSQEWIAALKGSYLKFKEVCLRTVQRDLPRVQQMQQRRRAPDLHRPHATLHYRG